MKFTLLLNLYLIFLISIASCTKKLPSKSKREIIFPYHHILLDAKEVSEIHNVPSKTLKYNDSTLFDSNQSEFSYFGDYKLGTNISIGKNNFSYLTLDKSPIVYHNLEGDKILLILDLGKVWSYNATSGLKQLIFKPKLDNNFYFSSLTLYKDNIIYNTNTGYTASISIKTKKITWETNNINYSFYSGFAIKNNQGYAISDQGNLFAIDLNTGQEIWSHISNKVTLFENIGSESFISTPKPVFHKDLVLYTTKTNSLIGVNAKNGEQTFVMRLDIDSGSFSDWQTIFSIDHPIFSPIIIHDLLFVSSLHGPFTIIDLNNGRLIDKKQFGLNSPITASGNFLYFITNEGELIAMHIMSGLIKWHRKLDSFYDYTLPKYLTDGKGYKRLKLNWRGPIMINEKIFVVSPFGKALLIDPNSGENIKEILLPKCIFSTPTVLDEAIYMHNVCDNTLYKLE